MGTYRFTILGCGSSGGVPRIGNQWGACDPAEPKNRRTRCSLLIERTGTDGITRVLVDTSPDMRAQLLAAGTADLDAVIYTHSHADHMHGIDDLRQLVILNRRRIAVWADPQTQGDLIDRFGYVFTQAEGSNYPPICDLHSIKGRFAIDGAGGTIDLLPFTVQHGDIEALGFKVANVAYLPDVSKIPAEVWPELMGLDCWIIDALRRAPHPTHAHLARTLEWIDRAAPRQAILTNMHNDLDYATLLDETPDNVTPAYDGLTYETG
ncbi:MAG: MBL fold metallo-hydrolase [Paracoccaceae bacterium]